MTGFESPIERLVEIHDHDDSGLDSDAKERDVADPHGHTEVVAEQFLQDQAASKRIECREDKHCRFGDGMKHHEEKHENNEKYDRQDNLQPLLGVQFEFILACPF